MKPQTLVQRLAAGIANARRSANFSVSGILPKIDPGLQIEGLGPVSLPLTPKLAKKLVALCKQAPYGKGTETLIDTKVRNAYELAPTLFTLTNPAWDEALQTALVSIAAQLGLPADRLEAQPYKLLFYRTGGHFVAHRDSEKSNRMVGSLIVALPTPFQGGKLTVRHQSASQSFEFKEAATGQAPCYAAFYADCEHEVDTVRDGFRLCLAYNLVLRAGPRGKKTTPAAGTTPVQELADAIVGWVKNSPSEPLVFALDHHYTQRGLALDLLKGNDRATADWVVAAAEQAGCHVFLCQVEWHVARAAYGEDDNPWSRHGRRRYWDDDDEEEESGTEDLELGEIYEEELDGKEWVDLDGKRQPFPPLDFDPAAIVASTPLEEWKPTKEEYEGYTGNAGNTLDRWYHRSALCVWHRNAHFQVLARGGTSFAIDLLESMVKKLPKTAKKRQAEARADCIGLAQGMIENWPRGYARGFYGLPEPSSDRFPALLTTIDDPDTTRLFLKCVVERCVNADLGKLIVAACRTHGIAAFAGELTALFANEEAEVRGRDFAWLDQLAGARLDDPARDTVLTKLAQTATDQFCRPPKAGLYYREDAPKATATLTALVHVLTILGDATLLERVVQFVSANTERFSYQDVQVPSLKEVVAWCRRKKAAVPPPVKAWLRLVQLQLQAATTEEPQPPTDWARPAEIPCTCAYCRQVNAFLADPTAPTGAVRASENERSHVEQKIRHYQCDVTHKLDKTGRPYSLIFSKTAGSFERRLKRYQADLVLLDTVNALVGE